MSEPIHASLRARLFAHLCARDLIRAKRAWHEYVHQHPRLCQIRNGDCRDRGCDQHFARSDLYFCFWHGCKGAACATILSQAVSALFVLWFLRSSKSSLHLQKRYFKLTPAIIGPCLMLGLSPFVMNITESLLSVCFNSSLLRYGGDVAVGAMAILASVMQFSMLPLQGLTQGSQPLISYNYGARKYDRIRKTFKILLVSALLYSSAMWALAQFMPQLLAHMFTNNAELVEYTCWAIRIYMAMCFCFGAQIACQQTFIALGNAKTSLFLALLRKVFLLIPLIYILPSLFENKVFAVF